MRIDLLIIELVTDTVRSLYGIDINSAHVEHPANRSWGDYSTNAAMVSAKVLGKTPALLAMEITSQLRNDPRCVDVFESIETAGPGFINFTLNKKLLLKIMTDVIKYGDNYGKCDVGMGSKIALEHSNVNPNKAAHIGHLRNAVIGQFVERVYEYIGYDVNVQYYANDLGVQVSTSLLGMEKLSGELDPANYEKFDHYAWDVYSKISQVLSEDANLKKELEMNMVSLDNRETNISLKQSMLAKRVLRDNLETFSKLDIDYDLIVYESSIKDMNMWNITFDILKDNPNVYYATTGLSKGCWLIKMGGSSANYDVEEDKIIVRSNGIPTYTGKDIAYHMWKFGLLGTDFKYNKATYNNQDKILYETDTYGYPMKLYSNNNIVIDVIDVKQTYAIDTIKKTLEYLGFKEQSENLIHINYGHVYLSKETVTTMGIVVDKEESSQLAMSGRKGIGIKIDDFIEMVEKVLVAQHGVFPNIKDVRNSAIKYDMLRYDTYQDVIFNVEESTNIKGYSGPYIEYTHARIVSLLEKASKGRISIHKDSYINGDVENLINSSAEKVLRELYKFPEIVIESAKRYAPNLICTYLYELCQSFNRFYSDSPVVSEDNPEIRRFRILLADSVRQVIKNGLYLLGIKTVDKM